MQQIYCAGIRKYELIQCIFFGVFYDFKMAKFAFQRDDWKELDSVWSDLDRRQFDAVSSKIYGTLFRMLIRIWADGYDSASDLVSWTVGWSVHASIDKLIWNIKKSFICFCILYELLTVLFGPGYERFQAYIWRQIVIHLAIVPMISNA